MPHTAPAWFVRAVAAEPERSDFDVAGCRVHDRAWGERDRPGLVLVHGGAAHSGPVGPRRGRLDLAARRGAAAARPERAPARGLAS